MAEEISLARGKNPKQKTIALVVLGLVIAIGGGALFFYLRYKETHVSTDDAFVDGRIHLVASKVFGTVRAVHVKDNQLVRKNDLLLEIDPADYEVKAKEAKAALEVEKKRLFEIQQRVIAARKQLDETFAALNAAKANLELHQANLRLSEADFKRTQRLVQKGALAVQQYDRAKTNYEVALAQVKSTENQILQLEATLDTQRASIKQVEAGIPPQEAQIRQKQASLEAAELNRSYTQLFAPVEGFVTKRSVEVGNQVQPGQPLMAIVPLSPENIWVTANYKETELKRIKPGLRVRIRVDTYPGKIFWGRVESIMAGTGAVFSLFPPENATGNFVKVVQRIPVKIVLERETDPQHLLRVGMSVVPTILVEP